MPVRKVTDLARSAMVASVMFTSVARAQTRAALSVIDGVVTDSNLVNLGGSTVSILGSEVHVATADNGRFRITGLRSGKYILTVHHIGYVPLAVAMAVPERDTLRPSFTLQPIATALDTMIVTAKSLAKRMSEFEDRRKLGIGRFITADEIEKRNSVYVVDIIRVVPSVGIAERKAGVQVAYSKRMGRACPFQLYLDGIPMPSLTNLANLPPPKDLAGIEIYSGPATIPLQYKFGDASCGVILLWTKIGG